LHVTNVLFSIIIVVVVTISAMFSVHSEEQCGRLSKFALTCCDITPTDQLVVFEICRSVMSVVWMCVYPTIRRLLTIDDSDTTWVKFTSLLAVFQTVGPVMFFAARCSFRRPSNPFGRAVGFSWNDHYTTNNIKHAEC